MITGPKTTAKWNKINPTHIGTVAGIRFFEHPTKGDESPLVIFDRSNTNRWIITEFWEVPGIEELFEFEAA